MVQDAPLTATALQIDASVVGAVHAQAGVKKVIRVVMTVTANLVWNAKGGLIGTASKLVYFLLTCKICCLFLISSFLVIINLRSIDKSFYLLYLEFN